MVGWETLSDDFWGDVLRLLRRWETPHLCAFASHEMFSFYLFIILLLYCSSFLPCLFFFLVVKERPELEGKFKERVQQDIKYVSTIDDFDELVNLRTLAHHCLGPKPSNYVLRAIDWEEKNMSYLSYFM